ncbi:MAG: DNA-binding protein [Bdellovibrionaceae bacterium]|nr:DNA-binding protein [Pseudobdellovibrionaceae bacterium]|tara:strand:+ start:3214 stop:3639 length:426 start_codon:yes stop_codon:yes gene_type:complete
MIRYQMKVHKEGNLYWAEFPDLPGCFTQADSRDELHEHAREALSLYLEEARDPKWKVPQPKSRNGKAFEWVMPYEDVAIALIIRQARVRAKLTQKELAKRLGISFQQVQKLETPGKSNPTVKTLVAISDALGGDIEIKIAA